MPKKIIILGATGTIGTQALEIIRSFPQRFELCGISANTSHQKLAEISREFNPDFVHLMDNNAYQAARSDIPNNKLHQGMDTLLGLISNSKADIVLAAMVGNIGLLPVITALENDIDIALANKETLVSGGHLVKKLLKQHPKVQLIPVDSEHSAIHQCLNGETHASINKILLTASGGSFKDFSIEQMKQIKPEQALIHPNWDMGAKITIDSSTMMNKGLEIIEAHWLFDINYEQIQVVVHPQSIIHSMVEFNDRSVVAQLGNPDMTLPIHYALNYPKRVSQQITPELDLFDIKQLSFEEPDYERFPCLNLAYEAGKQGGSLPTVMNAANEIAVDLFINNKIGFLEIPKLIEFCMSKHELIEQPTLEQILNCDQWARETAISFLSPQGAI